MDVNSVLQNTRQYFQGVPTSSPASGELAPGASVGYNSPPVSSTATVTATSASNLFPPYQQQTFSQQPPTTWNSSNSSGGGGGGGGLQNASSIYHQSSSSTVPNNTIAGYSRNYPPPPPTTSLSTPYHLYENAIRPSPKMLPSSPNIPPYTSQHNYLAPSVTRVKENPGQDLYNVNSMICPPNVNHVQNKKLKIKTSVLTTTASSAAKSPSASPSMMMYKQQPQQHQPTPPEEPSRYYNNRLNAGASLPPQPLPPSSSSSSSSSGLAIAPRLPSILPSTSSHAATPTQHSLHQQRPGERVSPNHSAYLPRTEQRVDYRQQQQTSYHTVRSSTTSIEEKLSQRDSNDGRYYNYRRFETTAAFETTPPAPSLPPPPPTLALPKRDSPLDLSVKTIRQSADSTAHDEAEAAAAAAAVAAYGQHFPVAAHQPLRLGEARHPQLPQLPYVPGVRSSSATASFNGTHPGRSHYYPEPPAVAAYNPIPNGQLAEDVIRNEMTVSITYQQKQEISRTQVNAQINTQYQYYRHTLDSKPAKALSRLPPPQPPSHTNHIISAVETNHLPALTAGPPNPRRKRPAVNETTPTPTPPPAVKNPRTSDWRESIDKEIEKRLNSYTSMKAREQEEERQLLSKQNDSYQNNNSSSAVNKESSVIAANESFCATFSPSLVLPGHNKIPPTLEHQQQNNSWRHSPKAQHKLPVQPIQMHPPNAQQWYPPSSQQRPPSLYPYDNTQQHKSLFGDAHSSPLARPYETKNELRVMPKIENAPPQKPLPSFQMGFAPKPPVKMEASNNKKMTEITREKEKSEISPVDITLAMKKEEEEAQARAALRASALTHPRIRTKAELKQGAPVDKTTTKDKLSASDKLPGSAQNVADFVRGSQLVASENETSNTSSTDEKSKPITNKEGLNHYPSTNSESETSVGAESKSYFPRKKKLLSIKADESRINETLKSSGTNGGVFDFRDDDSEPETSGIDPFRLNEMRKDRKIRPSSSEPTVIVPPEKEDLDDFKWLEACDELIQQFSNNNFRKPNRKKKADEEDDDSESPSPKKKLVKEDTASSTTEHEHSENDEIITPPKKSLPKETSEKDHPKSEKSIPSRKLESSKKKKEEITPKKTNELEEEKLSDKQLQSPEIRGQRSAVSTTRIKIQHQFLDYSSESDAKNDDSENSDSASDSENRENDGEEEDEDSEEEFDAERAKSKKTPAPTKPVTKSKITLRNKKVPLSRATLKKKTKKKMIGSKKLKKVDPKREKMRDMILRRMETRKSKLEAAKNQKKTKSESVPSTDEPQPRMTRKMALRESQKENKKEEPVSKKKSLSPVKAVTPVKGKSSDNKKDNKVVVEEKNTKRPETRKQVRDEKAKKSPDVTEKSDEVTRRTLRSRNVVVPSTEKPSTKSQPKNTQQPTVPQKDSGGKLKVKKEPRSEEDPKESNKAKAVDEKPDVKNNRKSGSGKDKEKNAKGDSKNESNASWEEALFNYKYSLRTPVKLINISGPNNWPKTPGGDGHHASSLPDLDRKETDSDILQGMRGQSKAVKKQNNKDETKFSNTKEFKDSVKFLQEKFDKKIEEKNQASNLTKLMMEKKMKIIPKSSDGPELLPTPSLDNFRSKVNSKKDVRSKSKDATSKADDDVDQSSFLGYFRKETVDIYKDIFEKHKPNQFETVILESRTRTQTKERKHHATLKQVFGCDTERPASAPPVPDTTDEPIESPTEEGVRKLASAAMTPTKGSTNGILKPWQKGFARINKFLLGATGDEEIDSDKDSRDFEESVVDFDAEEDSKDTVEVIEPENVVKKKSRTIRRKCRSSGFDYIRKKKKQKKEDDDDMVDEKEKKKVAVPVRAMPESIEDIQNEIKSWVVNKGIGETVLHKAARLGYFDISSYCLEKLNCSPSPTDNAGYTPLHEACTRGHLKIVEQLLKHGADVSASAKGGIRPLHEAVENGNIEVVRLLLSYGADPLLSTYGGQTPLSLVKDNQEDLREFLLMYLADIQGNPAKPWCFNGFDDYDREASGYNPLSDPPSLSVNEEPETLEIEMCDTSLPSLYRFKDEFDYWVLSTDLPARIRDAVTKRPHGDPESPSQYVIRKINRSQFEETVDCVMLLENKHIFKSKTKSPPLVTMVKYNEKLLSTLNVQKISMTFS